MKYYIITYGCQMNKSDSERIASLLTKMGYRQALKIDKADLIIVNMCSVRQSAVDRVYGLKGKILDWKTKKPRLKTILTGCILKKDEQKFSQFFDYLIRTEKITTLPKILKNKSFSFFSDSKNLKSNCYLTIKPIYSNKFSVNIPIMTGCNNFCAYCVVPYTRGREICRSPEEIISEIKNLVKKEVKEIWLLGQNVNSYNYNKTSFADLLKMINNIEGNFWIRFTSPHPKDFSDKLIKTMAECRKYKHYLNLPVQSGDDEILRKMKRGYTIKEYKNLARKIRKRLPDIALSTDIIVGFPGETKKQFNNTKKLLEEIKYDMAYIAQYSPRPGTLAEKMQDNVSKLEKKRREKILTEIIKKTALKKNKKLINQETTALITEKKSPSLWLGKTEHYKTIQVCSNKNLLGKFIKTRITSALTWGLKGELIKIEN